MAYQTPNAPAFETAGRIPALFDQGTGPMPNLDRQGEGPSPKSAIETALTRVLSSVPRGRTRHPALAISALGDAASRRGNLGGHPSATQDPMSNRRNALIQALLAGAFPVPSDGRAFLRPLWASEAMSRAHDCLQLVLMLERRAWQDPGHSSAERELELAQSLAGIVNSLRMSSETDRLPATEPLGGMLYGIVDLFGPAIGTVTLDLSIATIKLAPYRLRALVLTAAELLTKALVWSARSALKVQAFFDLTADGQVRLLIEHDGFPPEAVLDTETADIVGGLAALLEAELAFRSSHLGGTAAELLMPA